MKELDSPYATPAADSPVPVEFELGRQLGFWKRACAASLCAGVVPILIACGWSLFILSRSIGSLNFDSKSDWGFWGEVPKVILVALGLAVPGMLLSLISVRRYLGVKRELRGLKASAG